MYQHAEVPLDEGISSFFFVCGHCRKGVCVEADRGMMCIISTQRWNAVHRVYPEPEPTDAPKHTPPAVAQDFVEAKTSLRIGNFKAACIMAGSAIETALVEFGAQKGGLKDKIDKLASEHVLTPALAEWAHEVRGIRVDSAHQAERGATVSEADARQAVHFAEMLFYYLYTLPGMIAERRHAA